MIAEGHNPQAFWLTLGMARTVGANLPAAVFEGWLSRAELVRLVDRCDGCLRSRDCLAWLASAPGADARLPEFCPNGAEIEGLATRLR